LNSKHYDKAPQLHNNTAEGTVDVEEDGIKQVIIIMHYQPVKSNRTSRRFD